MYIYTFIYKYIHIYIYIYIFVYFIYLLIHCLLAQHGTLAPFRLHFACFGFPFGVLLALCRSLSSCWRPKTYPAPNDCENTVRIYL